MNAARQLLISLACCSAAAAQTDQGAKTPGDEIKAVIADQAEKWNAGDIEGFVDHYWKSDELTLSSGGQTRRGFDEVRRRYLNNYPGPEEMGRATFSDLEVNMMGDSAAFVLGRWALERDAPIGGNFTLVFRNIDGRWLIVHDHTSVQPADEVAPSAYEIE